MTAFATLAALATQAALSRFADTTATLDGSSVTGIYDAPYALGTPGGMGVAASVPSFTLASADVGADPVGQTLVIGSDSYTVAEHHPDGTGLSVLLLERTL